jgi:hypothetical protein
MTVLIAAESAALVLLAVLVAGLLRSHAQILARLHQLEASGPAPAPAPVNLPPPRVNSGASIDIAGVTPFDETVAIAVGATRVNTLLAFLSSGCSTCQSLWTGLVEGEGPDLPDRSRVVVVTMGPGQESPARLRRLAPKDTPVVMSTEAWQDYKVPGAPYFIWVDGTGRVRGEGSSRTWPEVSSLLAQAVGDGNAQSREERVDAELAAAGIHPGDPRLHHPPGAAG